MQIRVRQLKLTFVVDFVVFCVEVDLVVDFVVDDFVVEIDVVDFVVFVVFIVLDTKRCKTNNLQNH